VTEMVGMGRHILNFRQIVGAVVSVLNVNPVTWKNWFDIHGNVHALKSFKVDNSTLLRICFIFNFRCLSTTCKKCCSLETTVTGRNARWWWWKMFWLSNFRSCFQRNKNY
jgi:hypothetical protein